MPWRKPRVIHVDVYDIEIDLFDSMPGAMRYLAKTHTPDIAEQVEMAAGFTAMIVREDMTIAILMCVPPTEHRGTLLTHEVAHAAHMILDSRGVPISMENTEVSAYLQDYIFKQAAKHLGMET